MSRESKHYILVDDTREEPLRADLLDSVDRAITPETVFRTRPLEEIFKEAGVYVETHFMPIPDDKRDYLCIIRLICDLGMSNEIVALKRRDGSIWRVDQDTFKATNKKYDLEEVRFIRMVNEKDYK